MPDQFLLGLGPAWDAGGTVVVITSVVTGPRVNIALAGDVDASNVDRLRVTLLTHIDAGRIEIGIDISELSFIDCAGLTAVLMASACARASGGSLRLQGGMQPMVRRIIELTGAASLLTEPPPAISGRADPGHAVNPGR